MGQNIVVYCKLGFPVDFEYESKSRYPFHFHRRGPKGPMRCEEISRRIVENICCELYCCNCNHILLEPLED